jgi:hypothetical protein
MISDREANGETHALTNGLFTGPIVAADTGLKLFFSG